MLCDLDIGDSLHELITREPVRLEELPRKPGIYALHDHEGIIRYIGISAADRYGLYGRINNRHVTGSESRSHKFSHAYNTGRMWRNKKDSCQDAMLAKKLRTAFIRRHCHATFVCVPPALCLELPLVERAVQALTPREMLAWNSARNFFSLPEPAQLVEELLDDLAFTVAHRAAIERQAALFRSQSS